MEKYLKTGYRLKLEGKNGEFVIQSALGAGASTVAYDALYKDINGTEQTVIVKEFCPSYISFQRDSNGSIKVPEHEKERYDKGAAHFLTGCNRQLEVREHAAIRNQTPPAEGPFRANNTLYFVVSRYTGETLSACAERLSLTQKIKVMISLSKLVAAYHDLGYLCLDIKPDNIFVLPETEELIQVIDFDSIVRVEEIGFGAASSYSEQWAAPEQMNPYASSEIGPKTDTYLLGEVLFWLVFGKHSSPAEHRMFSKYSFASKIDVCPELDRRAVQALLTNIFRNTIRSSATNRFENDSNLVNCLEELLAEASQKEYVKDTIIPGKQFFVGREDELDKLDKLLGENQCVFVSGMAGIGKTELVKQYWQNNQYGYGSCSWIPYKTTFEESLADDSSLLIVGTKRNSEDTDEDYAKRKIEKLKRLASKNDLFIIDNANDTTVLLQSFFWNELRKTGVKIIVITRMPVHEYPCVEILPFVQIDYLQTIFAKYSPFMEEEAGYVDGIIQYVGYHTQLVELLAKQTHAIFSTPEKLLNKLKESGIGSLEENSLRILKDNQIIDNVLSNHISLLFSINEFSEKQIKIMLSAIMMPCSGVAMDDFAAFWNISSMNDITWLEERGWIQITRNDKYYLSIHPAMAVAVLDQIKRTNECEYYEFLLGLHSAMKQGYDEDVGRKEYWLHFKDNYRRKLKEWSMSEKQIENAMELAQNSFLNRSNIPYKEYVLFCDSIVKNIVRYSLDDENAYWFVIEYCKYFRKYGNAEQKIALLEWFHSHNGEKELRIDDDIYADLLIDAKRWKEAYEVSYRRYQLFLHNGKLYKNVLWCLRLAEISFNNHNSRDFFSNYFYARVYLKVYSSFAQKMSEEQQKEINEIKKEAYPRIAGLCEKIAEGFYCGKRWRRQYKHYHKHYCKWYKKAIKKRTLVKNSFAELSSENNILIAFDKAQIYFHTDNKIQMARDILEHVADTYQHKEYADISAIYIVYQLLGEICYKMSHYQDSEKYLLLALKTAEQLVLSDTLGARGTLGMVYFEMGRYFEAEELLTDILDELSMSKDEHYSTLADTYFCLAAISKEKSDLANALRLYSLSYEMYGKLDSLPRMLQCLCLERMANIYGEQKEYCKAVEQLQNANNLLRVHGFPIFKKYKEELKEYKFLMETQMSP